MLAQGFAQTKLQVLLAAVITSVTLAPNPVLAQAERPDAGSDAQDARNDALLAMPRPSGTAPLSNADSTAYGSETRAPARSAPRRHGHLGVDPEEGAVR